MEEPMKITAVCGWAIASEWFRERIALSFPQAEIAAIYPHYPDNADEAIELLTSRPSQLYIGYSLGSLWLMHHKKFLPPEATKALLAPILAFTSESNMGGKTSVTQLKYFIKMLKNNIGDTDALMDFYKRCNFTVPESWEKSIPDRQTLIRGLEFLCHTSVPAESASNFLVLVGEDDNFLDPFMLKCHLPHMDIVANAGHEPDKLLKRLAQQLEHPHKT